MNFGIFKNQHADLRVEYILRTIFDLCTLYFAIMQRQVSMPSRILRCTHAFGKCRLCSPVGGGGGGHGQLREIFDTRVKLLKPVFDGFMSSFGCHVTKFGAFLICIDSKANHSLLTIPC